MNDTLKIDRATKIVHLDSDRTWRGEIRTIHTYKKTCSFIEMVFCVIMRYSGNTWSTIRITDESV
jgi:hypothetical protein